MKPRSKKTKVKSPGAGRSGKAPPKEHQFKKGPDPKRGENRDTSGAIFKNCVNGLYRRNVRDATLRRLIADPTKPSHVRQAAEFVLHSRHATTIADFEPWLKGKKSLRQLKRAGVDISIIKSIHEGETLTVEKKDGTKTVTRGARSIQLYDHVTRNLQLMIEQTDGKPKQTTELKADVLLRTPTDRDMEADQTASRLRDLLKPARN